jgi:uncharacterized protein (TIGR02147 family)
MVNLFSFDSYKDFLKDYVRLHKRPGLMSELAKAATCDRTYLSQVLSSKVQLTPDHTLALADYFNFNEQESDFFLFLVLFERASNPAIRQTLKKKIQKLRLECLALSKQIKNQSEVDELSEAQKTRYYSNWLWSAVHLLTGIPDFQTIDSISNRLSVSHRKVQEVLEELQKMGLIKRTSQKWVHTGKNLHISSGSSHNAINHLNWRMKAVEQSNDSKSVHYSNVFSMAKKDWEELRQTLVSFIEKQRDFIHASGADDLYCFCCDLFSPF